MDGVIWIIIFVFGVIQVIMIFKFFEIASNISDIRNYVLRKEAKERNEKEQHSKSESTQENPKEAESITNKAARIVFYIILISVLFSLIMSYLK